MSAGIFTSQLFTQDLARKSFEGMITRLMPNGTAPLFGLTSMLESEIAAQIEHGFFSKTMLFPQLTVTAAGQTSGDTTFTVTSTVNVLPGMIMRVDTTGENVIVNAILSATQVSVTRGVGTIAAQAVGANGNLWQVGNAIEKAIFFGQKFQGTRNGQPFHMMDGIVSIVSNLAYYPPTYGAVNVTVAGGTTNYTQFEAAFDPAFNQATDPKYANERVLFVGGTAKKVINNIGRLNGTYFMVDGQTSWGLQFSTIKIARGTFRIIEHPLFNTNASWSKYAVAVDLNTFRLAYLGDRKTQHLPFNPMTPSGQPEDETAQDNGIDATGGTLTTELTTVIKNPPAFAIMTNLTAAALG